jgi:hypothetical protein
MLSVKVTYTVKPQFVAQNKQNINAFLIDLKQLVHLEFMYNVFVKEDELTFVHMSIYENENVQKQILNTPSFKYFQEERDKSGLTNKPVIETLNLVGSSLSLITS